MYLDIAITSFIELANLTQKINEKYNEYQELVKK